MELCINSGRGSQARGTVVFCSTTCPMMDTSVMAALIDRFMDRYTSSQRDHFRNGHVPVIYIWCGTALMVFTNNQRFVFIGVESGKKTADVITM